MENFEYVSSISDECGTITLKC